MAQSGKFLLWPHLDTQHDNIAGTRGPESDEDFNSFSAAGELWDARLC